MSGKRIGNPKILTTALAKTNQQGVPKTINDRSVAIPIKDVIDERLVDLNIIPVDPCCSTSNEGDMLHRYPVESGTTTLTLTSGDSGKLILLDSLTGKVITLPTAAEGLEFTFISSLSNTSNTYSIQGATSADLMTGSLINVDSDTANAVAAWRPNGSSNYKITGNTTTTALLKGSIVKIVGLGANLWSVSGTTISSGSVATPFAG